MCVCAYILGGFGMEMKASVPDRRKQPHVVRETNVFTRLEPAECGVNHARLYNSKIKERVQL